MYFLAFCVSLRDDCDDVVSSEDHGPDAAHVVFLRLFRVLEDHVHVVVIPDELPFEDPVVLEEQLNALVDGFFLHVKRHHHRRTFPPSAAAIFRVCT